MKSNTVGYGCRLALINLDDGKEVTGVRWWWWCWLEELCSMISDKYDTKPGPVKTSQLTNTTYGGDGMLTSMLS